MSDLTLAQRFDPRRFLRGDGPHTAPLTLRRQRVFILPSGQGVGYALLLVVMLLGSVNYGNSLGYMLTFLLASLGLVGMLHAYRNLLGLSVALAPIEPVFRGEVLHVPVILDNPEARPRHAVALRFDAEDARIASIPASNWTRVDLPLTTRRRGRHALPRITVETRFPLGLFRAWSHVRLDQDYLVYPQPAPERGLPPTLGSAAQPLGDQGRGNDDFAGLRGYQPGDSLRQIHWKLAAREQGLVTKRFGGDHDPDLWLDWQDTPGGHDEERLSRLTRWVLEAEQLGRRYGLRLPGVAIAPGHGDGHCRRCLEALALHGQAAS